MAKMYSLFETPWTIARQAPLSIAFPRQEYWSGLPFLSPGDLPNPEMELASPALAGRFFTTEPPGKLRKHDAKLQFSKNNSTKAKTEMSNLKPLGHVRSALLPSQTRI